jgi:hypothetical protein
LTVASQALELEQALRSEDEAALALRLARLEAALATVLEAARSLPAEPAREPPPRRRTVLPGMNGTAGAPRRVGAFTRFATK